MYKKEGKSFDTFLSQTAKKSNFLLFYLSCEYFKSKSRPQLGKSSKLLRMFLCSTEEFDWNMLKSLIKSLLHFFHIKYCNFYICFKTLTSKTKQKNLRKLHQLFSYFLGNNFCLKKIFSSEKEMVLIKNTFSYV